MTVIAHGCKSHGSLNPASFPSSQGPGPAPRPLPLPILCPGPEQEPSLGSTHRWLVLRTQARLLSEFLEAATSPRLGAIPRARV